MATMEQPQQNQEPEHNNNEQKKAFKLRPDEFDEKPYSEISQNHFFIVVSRTYR
jgi:hypothetical protein